MRIEAIAGLQVVWVVCPECGELLPVKKAHRTKTCPECGANLKGEVCEYGVNQVDLIEGGGRN